MFINEIYNGFSIVEVSGVILMKGRNVVRIIGKYVKLYCLFLCIKSLVIFCFGFYRNWVYKKRIDEEKKFKV